MDVSRAGVIVLAGPSGAGKSRLAERLGLPVLRLDDFYREAHDPGLPRIAHGPNHGLVDWDDPASWHLEDAMAALRTLSVTGTCEVPDYDISLSARVGSRVVDLGGHDRFVAEGIFATEVVDACEAEGLLVAAYCITQHPLLTFWRRLVRDLGEKRKPPHVLVLRGVALMRAQSQVVTRAVAAGCRVASGDEAFAELTRHGRGSDTLPR